MDTLAPASRPGSLHMTRASHRRPRVLVPACHREVGGLPAVYVTQKYLDAIALAGCNALVVPHWDADDLPALLQDVDGVLLTGSPSNVDPALYGQSLQDPALAADARRDAWTLPLVRTAIASGVPLLGICRGLQEINVALGGSLHQALHEVPGLHDHRADHGGGIESIYGPAHEVELMAGGLLSHLVDGRRIEVNSIHGQGIARLGTGLRVEARAPDGVIEAISAPDAPAFTLAVQWHPEWRAAGNEVSRALLGAFGRACSARHA